MARITQGGTLVYEASSDPYVGNVPIDFDDVLPAGQYRLFVQADGDIWIDSSFGFTLTASPGPPVVPAMGAPAWLELAGCIGALGVRAARARRVGRA